MLRVCNKEKQLQKNMVEHNKWLHRDSGQKAALTSEQHVILERKKMAIRHILQLGNPQLYGESVPLLKKEMETVQSVVVDLHDTMMNFREQYGAGRAIAAPQIGVMKRLIYMSIGGVPTVFINPRLKDMSEEMMEVWDDCMCFPDLLVKVMRHKSCRVRYRNQNWKQDSVVLRGDLSELLQHEYDHLEGKLFTDYLSQLRKQMVNRRLQRISKGNIDTDYPMKFFKKK